VCNLNTLSQRAFRPCTDIRIRHYSKKWPAGDSWFVAYLRMGYLPTSDRTVKRSSLCLACGLSLQLGDIRLSCTALNRVLLLAGDKPFLLPGVG
jgi:hypothetical protein